MRHTLVETNWVFGFAAPSHHKNPDAVELLARARWGELRLHLPSICLTEVVHPLRMQCQPREEADAIRTFLNRMRDSSRVNAQDYQMVVRLLSQFESAIKLELAVVPQILASLRTEPAIEIFPMNEAMLAKAVDLALVELPLRPFDQSVLASVLVRARELWDSGETDLCFCETDKDLQPLRKPNDILQNLYEKARVWVYEDFKLTKPVRAPGWPLQHT